MGIFNFFETMESITKFKFIKDIKSSDLNQIKLGKISNDLQIPRSIARLIMIISQENDKFKTTCNNFRETFQNKYLKKNEKKFKCEKIENNQGKKSLSDIADNSSINMGDQKNNLSQINKNWEQEYGLSGSTEDENEELREKIQELEQKVHKSRRNEDILINSTKQLQFELDFMRKNSFISEKLLLKSSGSMENIG